MTSQKNQSKRKIHDERINELRSSFTSNLTQSTKLDVVIRVEYGTLPIRVFTATYRYARSRPTGTIRRQCKKERNEFYVSVL